MSDFKYRKGCARLLIVNDKKFYHIDDMMRLYGEDALWEVHEAAKVFSKRYIDANIAHYLIDADLNEIAFSKKSGICKIFKIRDCMAIPKGYTNNH